MNRRSFLASMLAASAAPAIVRASSLMPVRVVERFRVGLPIVFAGDLIETVTPHMLLGQSYTYSTSFGMLLPDGANRIRRVWANGREVDLRPDRIVKGVAEFDSVPLENYGNMMPSIEVEI